jgi:hypothetical protein
MTEHNTTTAPMGQAEFFAMQRPTLELACWQANKALVKAIEADDGVAIAPIDDAFEAAFRAAAALYESGYKNKARALLSAAANAYAAWSLDEVEWDANIIVE